jgi:methylmalonyl-CoA mutase cobalamin-binding subunit
MKQLIKELKSLIPLGVGGIKQSFEDEGVLPLDVLTMRRITEQVGLDLSVKIGGCEAKTDIKFCENIGVDKIVAPMVETSFALSKFIESVTNINNIKFYINIESHHAQKNIIDILESPSSKLLSGIVLGRSDMIKSYGFSKDNVDGYMMNEIAEKVFEEAKKYGFNTIMGGNISSKSSAIIKKLYEGNLLESIETRNVIIKLNSKNIKNITPVIKSSLLFESKWLQYKANQYNKIGKEYIDRSKLILNRL